jgi:hypothetical protein
MRLAEKRCATFCTARIARGFVVLNPATAAAAVRSLTRRCEFHSFSSSARFFCDPVRASLWLALIIVLAVVFNSAYPAAGQNKATVSKKELKVLPKTATQPADHQRIADYYQQEAARLTASAKEHRELAAIYEKTPPNAAMEAKHGTSVEGVGPLPSLGPTGGRTSQRSGSFSRDS